jgi:hypothetical protein
MYKLEGQWDGKWTYVGHYGTKNQAIKDAKKFEEQGVRTRIIKSS